MIRRWTVRGFVLLYLALFACIACGGSTADAEEIADKRTDGGALTADDRAAAEFLRDKLNEHYVKGADGWTTQFLQYNLVGEVMPGVLPVELFRQYRTLTFTIKPERITEAGRLNNVDYRGIATFKDSPVRYFHTEAGYETPQGWAAWEDHALMMTTVAVERRNGKWITSDSLLFNGVKPQLQVP